MTLYEDFRVYASRKDLALGFCIPYQPMRLVDPFLHVVDVVFRPELAAGYEC
jgi:hypothetical protein